MVGVGARSYPLVWVLAWLLLLLTPMAMTMAVAVAAPATPGPPRTHVDDEVGVMSSAARKSLSRRLASYEARSGHQIIVWIGQTAGGVPIEDFAVQAFESWKIGRADLDDGLGVFVLVDDRAVRVEVGYGLESTITDLQASQVIRSVMIPKIQSGEWDAAIVGGVEALVDTIEGATGSLPPDPGDTGRAPEGGLSKLEIIAAVIGGLLFIILLITNPHLALLLLVFLGRGGGGGGGGGGGFHGGGGRSGGGGATGRW
jgi:uncharacterized protein